VNSDKEKFFVDGRMSVTITQSDSLRHMLSLLHGMLKQNKLKDTFFWDAKYEGTLDLRPNVYDYDDVFLDFLFENNIPDKINDIIGHDLSLYHIQIRRTNSESSYMPWHRDSYFISGKQVGKIPPTYKLIYYPMFGKDKKCQLQLLKGSHHNWFPHQKSNEFLSPGFSHYDKQLFNVLGVEEIFSGNDEAIFFDSSMLHNVIGDDAEGSIRLMFSFIEYNQFTTQDLNKPLHADLRKMYSTRLAKMRRARSSN